MAVLVVWIIVYGSWITALVWAHRRRGRYIDRNREAWDRLVREDKRRRLNDKLRKLDK